MIKQYLMSKTHNELIAITIGFIVSCCLVLYFGIWTPIHNAKMELLDEIQAQHELISWMQEKAPLLKKRPSQLVNKDKRETFSVVEDTFKKQTTLFPKLSIARNSATKVTINFNEIPFDAFMKQLIVLKNLYHIDIDEAQITKSEKPGFVQGKIVLEQ